MSINKALYKKFSHIEAIQWGKQYFNEWFIKLQQQDYVPLTPAECFFRYYTQGIDYIFNRILRYSSIDKYNFKDSCVSKAMFVDSNAEINKHKLCEDIRVYRYVSYDILQEMKKASRVHIIRKNAILIDKGYFSTTLCLDSVRNRHYAKFKDHCLLTVYVPKGTPCVYVDLISDMGENELLFAPNIKLRVLSRTIFGKFIECVVINE